MLNKLIYLGAAISGCVPFLYFHFWCHIDWATRWWLTLCIASLFFALAKHYKVVNCYALSGAELGFACAMIFCIFSYTKNVKELFKEGIHIFFG